MPQLEKTNDNVRKTSNVSPRKKLKKERKTLKSFDFVADRF